ncbi:MAG: T9SS type A sorting domain-containing protein [Ignavibacteria bacterium]|nr:T9SS type A sorting domain-containing protein [Ignavibacteria bacterium]
MKTLIVTIIFMFLGCGILAQPIPADSLYLGQVPPGYMPKVFVLPINGSLRPIERITISADGKEIYFGQLNTYPASVSKVLYYRYSGNSWQGPTELFSNFMAPSLSPNDSLLITQASLDYYTAISYYSRRTPSGWTTPVQMFHFSNQSHYTMFTSLNNIFTSSSYGGSNMRDISRVIISGGDTSVVSLGMPICTNIDESDFFVARDESYIIHARHTSSVAGDLLISYKKPNGGWTNSKSLGSHINLPNPTWEYGPFVTHDGKYLFFTRGDNSWNSYLTYWVKIDNIIDSLKHTNFAPYLKYQIPNQSDSVNRPFSFTFADTTFIDDDGNNTLSYSATLGNGSSLPSWLNFDPQTRTIWGTPTSGGPVSLKITATDTAGASASCTFTLNVLGPIGIQPINSEVITKYCLRQNYPNPFNPETEILFDVAVTAFTKLIVYDAAGREVRRLVDQMLKTGRYKVGLDAMNLCSGIYFYRLESGSFALTRKMILLK